MRIQLAATILLFCTAVTATPQTSAQLALNVTASTEKAFILDLNRDSFSVNVDKHPVSILSFHRDVPASIGILIDTSGSVDMHGPKSLAELKQNLKAGLELFVQHGTPANEYFVMAFNQDVAIVQDWTSERALVTDKLDKLEFKTRTALYDAITRAVPKVMTGRRTKHVLLIISDGVDTYSRNLYKDVRELLKKSDVIVYVVGVINNSEEMRPLVQEGATILDEFASHSGGRALFSTNALKAGAFNRLFESIAIELRSQYQLVISPEASTGKEKWRKLNVTATRNKASGKTEKLIVRARQGFYL